MKKYIFSSIFIWLTLLINAQIRIDTPVLESPTNNAIKQTPDVCLNWNPVIDADKYQVQLSEDDSFEIVSIDTITELTCHFTKYLKFNFLYHWRVRAIENQDTSYWTPPFLFTTMKLIELDKPNDGSDDLNGLVDLKWKKYIVGSDTISGLKSFELQYDTSYYFQTFLKNESFTRNFKDISVTESGNAWLIYDSSLLVRFSNSGSFIDSTFKKDTTITKLSINAIEMLNDSIGYCVGNSGFIAKYQNNQWLKITDTTLNQVDKNLNDVYIFNENKILIVGDDGTLINIINDTITIQTLEFNGNKHDLFSLEFFDENNGWCVGESVSNKAGIFKYADGIWQRVEAEVKNKDLYDIVLADTNGIWTCGESGTMLKYENGSWIKITLPDGLTNTKKLFTIEYTNGKVIMLGEEGTAVIHNIVTQEWTVAKAGTLQDIFAIDHLANNDCVFVGKNGIKMKFIPNAIPFTSPILISKLIAFPTYKYSVPDLYFSTVYCWRVRGIHLEDTSSWSTTRSFNTLDQIALKKPNNNSVDQALNVDLRWDELSGFKKYDYQVDIHEDFSTPTTYITELTTVEAEDLKYGTKYYWRMRGRHDYDTTNWSAAWNFTTWAKVNLTSPAEGTDSVELKPQMKWSQIMGTTGYEIEYSSDNNFAGSVINHIAGDDATLPFFNVLYALDPGTMYYWRVRAYTEIDTSDYSTVGTFVTLAAQGFNDNFFGNASLNIYPNPASNVLNINLNNSSDVNVELEIIDLVGQAVIKRSLHLKAGENQKQILLDEVSNGVYMVKFIKDDAIYTSKLIINK